MEDVQGWAKLLTGDGICCGDSQLATYAWRKYGTSGIHVLAELDTSILSDCLGSN
jgi:hypothetical protein